MRRAEDLQVAAPDAEHRVAAEIDALDIRAYRKIGLRNAEVQPAIVGVESRKCRSRAARSAGVSSVASIIAPGSAAERRASRACRQRSRDSGLHLVLACTSWRIGPSALTMAEPADWS